MVRIVTYGVALFLALLIILPYFFYDRPEKEMSPKERPQINESNIVKNKLFEPSFFMPCLHFYLEGFPEDVAAGDVDNDGKNDVIVLYKFGKEAESRLNIFTQNASVILERPMHSYKLEGDIRSIAAGDIDDDGKDEMIIVDNSTNMIRIFAMRQFGNMTKIAEFTVLVAGKVTMADMNGDGLDDIVLIKDINSNSFMSEVIYQQKDKTLKNIDLIPYKIDIGDDENINGIVPADMNADGKAEFVISHSNAEFSAISIADADSPYKIRSLPAILDKPYTNPVSLAVTDINSDGRNDIIVMYRKGLWIYLQYKNGEFLDPIRDWKMNYSNEMGFDSLLAIGDVNSDEKMDLVIITQTIEYKHEADLDILCRTTKEAIK